MAWLKGRGCEAEQIEAAVARLTELGTLDDERFARLYAADQRELSGWGAERIREALAARGLDPATIEATIGPSSPADEVERAAAALERRGEALAGDAARNRALGFLTRRGYDYEVAYEAIRRVARAAA